MHLSVKRIGDEFIKIIEIDIVVFLFILRFHLFDIDCNINDGNIIRV